MKGFLLYYTNIIPVSAIAFVSLLLAYKIYIKIRSKFKVRVNCWFCNKNTKVPYDLYNSWVCPYCEQYNGFTKDGDYNREILAQYACKFTDPDDVPGAYRRNSPPKNGLCDTCNENQRMKVEKLAQFEPENDSSFNVELDIYRKKLEEKYRLCVTCERHLNKILRDKKKMILGSKFASLLSKRKDLLKIYSKFQHLRTSNKISLKTITSITLLVFAFVNFVISANELTENKRNLEVEEDILANILFFISSHLVALTKVLSGYIQCIWNIKFIEKLYLYIKTVMFLIYYTIGFKVGSTPTWTKYITIDYLPFGSIFLAFISNILDGFKISKNTFLLTVWSIYAGVTNSSALDELYSMDSLKVITSAFVMLLSIPDFKESSRLLLDTTTNSFHRIYSEDYFTDTDSKTSSGFNDTILNTSSTSNASVRSFDRKSIPLRTSDYTQKTSSVFNLNTSLMSAFKEYSSTDNNTFGSNQFLNLSQNNPNNSIISNHSCIKPCSPLNIPESNNVFTATTTMPFHSNSRIIQKQVTDNFYPSPVQSPFSYTSQSTCRQSLLSPARLSVKNSNNTMQTSWVSGGYFNKSNCADKRNYFLDSTIVSETLSRASSQSSGFESQSSLLNGEKASRENSYCPETDIFPNSHEHHNKFDTFMVPHRITENSIDLLPRPESFSTNHTNGLLSSPLPQFSNHPLTTANSFATHQPAVRLSTKSDMSPFDLNKMGDDLPHIQRGSLLRKWKEQNNLT